MNITRNNHGISIAEALISLSIVVGLLAAVMMTLTSGQDAWRTTGAQADLRENLRVVLLRMSKELRETGSNGAGVSQLTIGNGTGVNGSDTVTFSIPVFCQTNSNLIDTNGNVSYWGAPLTWGCSTSSCMDADNDCSTVDYKYIQYRINNSNQLERRILNNVNAVVRTDILAEGITDLQLVFNGEDANMNCIVNGGEDVNGNGRLDGGARLTLTINGIVTTAKNRQINSTATTNIFIRNRGCAI